MEFCIMGIIFLHSWSYVVRSLGPSLIMLTLYYVFFHLWNDRNDEPYDEKSGLLVSEYGRLVQQKFVWSKAVDCLIHVRPYMLCLLGFVHVADKDSKEMY